MFLLTDTLSLAAYVSEALKVGGHVGELTGGCALQSPFLVHAMLQFADAPGWYPP